MLLVNVHELFWTLTFLWNNVFFFNKHKCRNFCNVKHLMYNEVLINPVAVWRQPHQSRLVESKSLLNTLHKNCGTIHTEQSPTIPCRCLLRQKLCQLLAASKPISLGYWAMYHTYNLGNGFFASIVRYRAKSLLFCYRDVICRCAFRR